MFLKDWFCNLKDSTVVWDKEVVHECPFRKVSNSKFTNKGPYLIDNKLKLALQIKRMEIFYGIEMLVTTEGLYVAPISEKLDSLLINDGGDTKELSNLMLADSDYKSLENYEEEYQILYKECKNFVYMLKLFALQKDKFMRIEDFKGSELIVYTHNSQIYLPNCVNITTIKLVPNSKSCYEDVPIMFSLNNKFLEGYLTNDRIIKAYSKELTCDSWAKFFNFPNSNMTLVRTGKVSKLVKSNSINFAKVDFSNHLVYKNFTHLNKLVNGVDIIGQMHKLTQSNEVNGQWLVIPDEDSESKSSLTIIATALESIKNWFLNIAKSIIYSLLGILFGSLAIFLVIKCCIMRRKNANKQQTNQSEVQIETQNEILNPTPLVPKSNNKDGINMPKLDLTKKHWS